MRSALKIFSRLAVATAKAPPISAAAAPLPKEVLARDFHSTPSSGFFTNGGITGGYDHSGEAFYSTVPRENKCKVLSSLLSKPDSRNVFSQGTSNVIIDVLRENYPDLNIFYHAVDAYHDGLEDRLQKTIAEHKRRFGFNPDPELPTFSMVSISEIEGAPTSDPFMPNRIGHAIVVCCYRGKAVIFDNNAGKGLYGYESAIESVRLAYEKEGFDSRISDLRTTLVKGACGYASTEVITSLINQFEKGVPLEKLLDSGLSIDDPDKVFVFRNSTDDKEKEGIYDSMNLEIRSVSLFSEEFEKYKLRVGTKISQASSERLSEEQVLQQE